MPEPASRALIVGIKGPSLDADTRRFIEDARPLGFILFARNVENPDQVRALVMELRALAGRADAPVLIDQEGGRVARLTPPHWRAAPPAAAFGKMFGIDTQAAREAVALNARLIGAELADLGINVDCAPVCDVPVAGADPIIGDRAFGTEPEPVAALAESFCNGLIAAGVLPVIKHIPGHGRADVDSHKALPRVAATAADLASRDFAPFAALSRLGPPVPWAMTAHVVYEALDSSAPATMSSHVIGDVVRGQIGFGGVIISDDLSMHALTGPFDERARRVLAAGCDLVLHCNGDLDEMAAVADGTGMIGPESIARLDASLGALAPAQPFDRAAALAHLNELMAGEGA